LLVYSIQDQVAGLIIKIRKLMDIGIYELKMRRNGMECRMYDGRRIHRTYMTL